MAGGEQTPTGLQTLLSCLCCCCPSSLLLCREPRAPGSNHARSRLCGPPLSSPANQLPLRVSPESFSRRPGALVLRRPGRMMLCGRSGRWRWRRAQPALKRDLQSQILGLRCSQRHRYDPGDPGNAPEPPLGDQAFEIGRTQHLWGWPRGGAKAWRRSPWKRQFQPRQQRQDENYH